MIFAIIICISLVIMGFSWFLYRRNVELFLCLLITINFEFYYILPKFAGYQYLLLPMLAILLFAGYLNGQLSIGRYGWWIICFMGISLLGVMVAWYAGQNIVLGIKAAKFIPLVLVYFLLAGRQVNIERFTTYFIIMGFAVAFLATISYLAHGAINIFPGIPQEKLADQSGHFRVTAGQYVIAASAVMAYVRYLQSSRTVLLLVSAALLGEVIVVQQTRGFIVGIILSMFVVYILSNKLTMLRVSMYIIFGGLFLLAWLLLSNIDLSGIGVVKRVQADMVRRGGSYGGSLQARLNGYDYYWKQMQKQLVTGRGMMNYNWEDNDEKKLQMDKGIHLSDIGIVHFLVQAGLIGAVWLLYGLIRLWKDIFRFRKQLIVACYFVIGTFTLPTLDMFLRPEDSMFLFAVLLGLSSSIIMTSGTAAEPTGV